VNKDASVYDLGNLDRPSKSYLATVAETKQAATATQPVATPSPVPVRPTSVVSGQLPPRASRVPRGVAWPASLSLFLPGAGQMATGGPTAGVGFLSGLGLVAALVWAISATPARLAPTLEVLSLPRGAGVWLAAALLPLAAALHIAAVLTADRRRYREATAPPHPAVSALASLLVPGWGQTLNGDRWRAALFLSGTWLVASTWILPSAHVGSMLAESGLVMPRFLTLMGSAVVRWTLPALLCTMAAYDAAVSSAHKR
jgi:hypothetical protein